MYDILAISERNQKHAWDIIKETGIIKIWESFSATINLVGSLKTGLLMKNRDIDFHIYSDPFSLSDSFTAIYTLAKNPRIKRIEYINLLDTNELCVEWHAWYLDKENELWQIDMIHILKESAYAGKFEIVADRIISVLTKETKYAILSIKNEIPQNMKIMGIEIYQAVIQYGIRNYQDFIKWREKQNHKGIIDWMP
jgi:hypothetical protein